MSTREKITEVIGSMCFLALLSFMVVFGLSVEPRYPSMHSEAYYQSLQQYQLAGGYHAK